MKNELLIGQTHLSFDGNHLFIKEAGQGKPAATIAAGELLTLHGFIGSIMGLDRGQRQAYRLHKDALVGLSAVAIANGKEYPIDVQDLSMTGLHFRIKPELGLSLSPSDKFSVTLSFQGERQTQPVVLRRKTESGYTVFFPNSLKGQDIDPPRELTSLVMNLQRRWLSKLAKFGNDGLV